MKPLSELICCEAIPVPQAGDVFGLAVEFQGVFLDLYGLERLSERSLVLPPSVTTRISTPRRARRATRCRP